MTTSTSIPQEFVTRVDFTKFWNSYFEGGLNTLTREDLCAAKDALLGEQVPTFTVYAYFQPRPDGCESSWRWPGTGHG